MVYLANVKVNIRIEQLLTEYFALDFSSFKIGTKTIFCCCSYGILKRVLLANCLKKKKVWSFSTYQDKGVNF